MGHKYFSHSTFEKKREIIADVAIKCSSMNLLNLVDRIFRPSQEEVIAIATKDPYDSVQRLDHLRNACCIHDCLCIHRRVLFTKQLLVFYFFINGSKPIFSKYKTSR